MKELFKNFNFLKVTLTIVTICSIGSFYGVFKILKTHQRIISVGAKTDMDMVKVINGLEGEDANCQDRLKVLELENKVMREQIDTLFEFKDLYHGDDPRSLAKKKALKD